MYSSGADKFRAVKDCLEKPHSFVKTASNVLERKYRKLLVPEYLGRCVVCIKEVSPWILLLNYKDGGPRVWCAAGVINLS